ncbi:glycosyltransferase (plasmid) [Azospirillum melinis]|uniref:glycosyltransferase n=1 Tax=Azospirillum melinis TaxID=328839 RepID=UPI0037562EA0
MIITPLGPGHEGVAAECRQSVRAAATVSSGPFTDIFHLIIDDRQGAIGRSAARNQGISRAREAGTDWLFFLDADDLMLPSAFSVFQKYEADYDAVWGMICEMSYGHDCFNLRNGQLGITESFHEILSSPPFLSIQIGHFVRTSLAESILFDERMDSGEDFEFYCQEWTAGRCVKTNEVFFINRRGFHSTGPRSADRFQWLNAAEQVIDKYRKGLGSLRSPFFPVTP